MAICSGVYCLKDLKLQRFSAKEGIVRKSLICYLACYFERVCYVECLESPSTILTIRTIQAKLFQSASRAQEHPTYPTYPWECYNIGSLFFSFCQNITKAVVPKQLYIV